MSARVTAVEVTKNYTIKVPKETREVTVSLSVKRDQSFDKKAREASRMARLRFQQVWGPIPWEGGLVSETIHYLTAQVFVVLRVEP